MRMASSPRLSSGGYKGNMSSRNWTPNSGVISGGMNSTRDRLTGPYKNRGNNRTSGRGRKLGHAKQSRRLGGGGNIGQQPSTGIRYGTGSRIMPAAGTVGTPGGTGVQSPVSKTLTNMSGNVYGKGNGRRRGANQGVKRRRRGRR